MRHLFAFLLAAFLLTGSGHLYLGDAWSMLRTAEVILTRGQLAIDYEPSFGGKYAPDGRFYAKYGPAVAVHMLIPAAVGHALESLAPGPRVEERRILMGFPASFLNAPFTALACTMFFGVALALGYRARAALWCTLALAFGTMVWPYAKHDAFEPQMMAALMVGLYHVVSGRYALAGMACGWALLVKPVAVLVAVPLAAYVWARRGGWPALATFSQGPVVSVLVLLGYNYLRFGSVLETGYSSEVQGFTIPLVMGVYGLLLSAGKGILWYSPALVAAMLGSRRFAERHLPEWRLIVGTFVVHVVFYACQQSWDGDWCWGPRYLLPCIPLLMLLALPAFDDPPTGWTLLPLGVLAGLALGVQVLGVAVNPSDYTRWVSDHKATLGDFLRQPQKVYIPVHHHHFNPDFSPIRGHMHLLGSTLAASAGAQPGAMVIYSSVEERTDKDGHHLELPIALPVTSRQLGIDIWVPLLASIARQNAVAYVTLWALFALLALALVKQRRLIWRLVRESEA